MPVAEHGQGWGRLTVMSVNVRGFSRRRDGINSWEHRAALNVATIRRSAPDVIGVQELRPESLATYRAQLPGYACVIGPGAGRPAAPEFNAILFDPARLQVLETGGFWLSETPDRFSSAWRARIARSANWVLFSTPDAVPFLHLNTHLDHLSGLARLRGSDLLVRRITALRDGDDLPTVVTGDFNCRPGSAPYRRFADAGFRDTALAAGGHERETGTFHAFHGFRHAVLNRVDALRGARRIDWILVAGGRQRLRVEDHAVVRDHDAATGMFPSDHYPVLSTLAVSG